MCEVRPPCWGHLWPKITVVLFSCVAPEKLESEKLNVAEVTQSEIAQKQKLQTVLEKINETLKLPPRSIKWNVDCECYRERRVWGMVPVVCTPRSQPGSWPALGGCRPIHLTKEGHISYTEDLSLRQMMSKSRISFL